MSTNYYFKINTDDRKLSDDELLNKYLMDQLDTEIHIGMRSGGWVPTFQETEYYKSVKEIREFYDKHKDSLTIINEYYDELSFEELEEELINWNRGYPEAKSHMQYPHYYKDAEGYEFTDIEFS